MEEKLSPQDRELFLKVWNLSEDDWTDEEILMAISLGHF
ncbi:MAG: hypothetical protein RIS26_384 [Actinomycetota bacterium]|jgi:hypothetical protein